ncbi:N-acetylglucosamine kinase [Saccharibacillus endophyticus]|uniref:ATPase n=1 Tax=Saccharibacillus endophyticus TaxID=2060666 RepID=A0ABQ1ZY07_9BACL|nr:BadF/BadG/BcrA/BcrD ATPase family protein [Saccharibacillus endophyticus]GGH82200.1 ATPase [Saccharibacillus endophyticus]
MKFFAGIDGGGTKTEAAALDARGRAICRIRGGSTNPHAVGTEKAFIELTSIFERLFRSPELSEKKCVGISLGMSGIDGARERKALEAYLKQELPKLGADCPFELRTEGEIALAAALGKPEGLQVIAGTGSIVYGFLPGIPRARAGGWGHLLGDEGGGYRIGLRALRLAARAFDAEAAGDVGLSPLADEVRGALGLDTPEALKRWVYAPGTGKAEIAALAATVLRACESGDSDARRIVEDEAAKLAAETAGLLRRRPEFAGAAAVLGGSIFGHSPSFRNAFARRVNAEFPRLTFVDGAAGSSPAEGAALLALRAFGG